MATLPEINGIMKPLYQKISDAGFVILERPYSQVGGFSWEHGWRPVIDSTVSPTIIVDDTQSDYLDVVNSEWFRLAKEAHLFASDLSFLISPYGEDLKQSPWSQVRLSEKIRPAHELIAHPGQPEFVAMSNDGKIICAVTPEDDGIWIVCRNLDG